MSFIKDYLNNLASGLLNPKGSLGDYSHAGNLFVNGQHRLSPKSKYLYACEFQLSDAGRQFVKTFDSNPVFLSEFNLLVKNIDLPKMSMEVEARNQYNRKKNVQTSISYDPVNITFHDDSFGITTGLLEGYYRYYYVDGNYTTDGMSPEYNPRNLYKGENYHLYRYGFDNESTDPFFNKITIYQMDRHLWTSFTLVNPIITSIGYDSMDYYESSSPVQTQVSLMYEAVFFDRGNTDLDPPPGIGGEKYDNVPSPLTPGGGGTSTLLGQGGVLEGIGSVFSDIGSGNIGLGTVIDAVNTFQNAKDLTSEAIKQEGINILAGATSAVLEKGTASISNIVFPSLTQAGTSLVQSVAQQSFPPGETLEASFSNTAVGGVIDTASSLYEEKIRTAESNNERTGGG